MMPSDKKVISLFDLSGKMVKPWAEAGYKCICVDWEQYNDAVQHENITYINKDVREFLPCFERVGFVFGFPPCTDLSVSGARWWEKKREEDPGFQHKAMHLLFLTRDIGRMLNATWMVENPVGKPSTLWKKPDYYFHPYEYDGYTQEDNCYTKKTCLWTSDDFVMPDPKTNCEDPDERIHRAAPGENRSRFRSVTPQGFANAVFEANY